MPLDVHQFPCLSDNYGFLVRDEATGQAASIDTPDAGAILARAGGDRAGTLDLILNTHWHPDHAGGNAETQGRDRRHDRRARRGDAHRAHRPRGAATATW